jgi:hypothetical protein
LRCFIGTPGQKYETRSIFAGFGQLEARFIAYPLKEFVRDLEEYTDSVSGIFFTAACATV